MDTSEKNRFVAESLGFVHKKYINQFKKSKNKHFKSIEETGEYGEVPDLLMEASEGTLKAMVEWENTSLDELCGMTPRQYFESLNDINEINELLAFILEKHGGMIPLALIERIKKSEDAFLNELITKLKNICFDENKGLNSMQKATVQMAEFLPAPQLADTLLELFCQLDEEKSDEDTYSVLIDAIRAIGEPVLERLINALDNCEKNGRLYTYIILTIGKIASENKTERIYRLLKDYFRKSDMKYVEANALAIYGDGRAIPAIRGYVERNLEDLPYWEYSELREAVLLLGGDMSDLDEHFDYDYYDECEDYDEFDDEDYDK